MFYKLVVIFSVLTASQCQQRSSEHDNRVTHEIRGSYGYRCINACDTRGSNYNWCDAEHPTETEYKLKYWDYCSPKDDVDYQGNRCRTDHACGTHGYRYKWCYLDDGSWGYCSYSVRILRN